MEIIWNNSILWGFLASRSLCLSQIRVGGSGFAVKQLKMIILFGSIFSPLLLIYGEYLHLPWLSILSVFMDKPTKSISSFLPWGLTLETSILNLKMVSDLPNDFAVDSKVRNFYLKKLCISLNLICLYCWHICNTSFIETSYKVANTTGTDWKRLSLCENSFKDRKGKVREGEVTLY